MHDFAILYVEDEETDVIFFKRALNMAGVKNRVIVAINGQEAIDYLSGAGLFSDRERYPLPGLVLLDLKLPHRSGLEVLKWIRSDPKLKNLLVVVYTSSNQPKDVEEAYSLGANGYIVKQGNPEQLTAIAKAFRDYWLVHNEQPKVQP